MRLRTLSRLSTMAPRPATIPTLVGSCPRGPVLGGHLVSSKGLVDRVQRLRNGNTGGPVLHPFGFVDQGVGLVVVTRCQCDLISGNVRHRPTPVSDLELLVQPAVERLDRQRF